MEIINILTETGRLYVTHLSYNPNNFSTDMSSMIMIEATFDWHWALTAGENVTRSTLQNKLFEIRAQVLIE